MEDIIQAHYKFRISKINTHNPDEDSNKIVEVLEILYRGKWQHIDDRLINSLIIDNEKWLSITPSQLSDTLDDVFIDIKNK